MSRTQSTHKSPILKMWIRTTSFEVGLESGLQLHSNIIKMRYGMSICFPKLRRLCSCKTTCHEHSQTTIANSDNLEYNKDARCRTRIRPPFPFKIMKTILSDISENYVSSVNSHFKIECQRRLKFRISCNKSNA